MAYLSVDKIAVIRLQLHKVLPAVYDESLSYLEGLSKLTYKLNETIGAVNALNDNVDVLNDKVVELNDRVTAVEGEIDGFEAEITQRIAELETELNNNIDTAIADMNAQIDGRLSSIELRIAQMETYVTETINGLIRSFQAIIAEEIKRLNDMYSIFEEEMRQYVVAKIDELIAQIPDLTNIYVVGPASGKLMKVQNALDEVFAFNLYNALTCDEFNELGFTCNELNSLMVDGLPRGFTVWEWLHDAKKLLIKILPINKIEKWLQPNSVVRGYLSGVKDWLYKNVDLNANVWLWSGTFTCDELVTIGKSCDEIITYNMSCDDYLMNGNAIMV